MAKITDYPKIDTLVDNNVFLVDQEGGGTHSILASNAIRSLLSLISAEELLDKIRLPDLDRKETLTEQDRLLIGGDSNKNMLASDFIYAAMDLGITPMQRRNTFRGKNLGSVVTEEQLNAIDDGSFRGMFIGDYWVIGDRTWRIMDMDYWLGTGDIPCTTHHLVIMPDYALYDEVMNDSATTEGGYVGSKMYKTGLNRAKSMIYGAFGEEHILSHSELLSNARNAGTWIYETVLIPNESMIYGYSFQVGIRTTETIYRHTISIAQLSGMCISSMMTNPQILDYSNVSSYWSRDMTDDVRWSLSVNNHHISYSPANIKQGVRPVFGLKK